jgi:excisionase family DNA binding protein
MNSDQLVTPQEMAAILNVPVSWIYQRTRLGPEAIPHIKMGKYVRFKPAEVINFYQAKEKNAA